MPKDKDNPMRLPDAEASTRICPFTRDSDNGWAFCMGSKCMAWRWVGKEEPGKVSEGFCGMPAQFASR